jgi:DNA-directed RNA polymerase specialized sigma24 family protein
MEPPEQLKQKVLTEKRLTNRLRLATTRLEDAQQEHIWAIAAAKSEGLSIRKIAAATDLSSSRVHQLLHTNGALQIPTAVLSWIKYSNSSG